jgi:hypothetical protein
VHSEQSFGNADVRKESYECGQIIQMIMVNLLISEQQGILGGANGYG